MRTPARSNRSTLSPERPSPPPLPKLPRSITLQSQQDSPRGVRHQTHRETERWVHGRQQWSWPLGHVMSARSNMYTQDLVPREFLNQCGRSEGPQRCVRARAGCGRPRITIVYWEPALLSSGGPSRCYHCDGVRDSWRHRLDNLQATVRACGKEGRGFRPDVETFAAVSAQGALVYDLEALYLYMQKENKRAPTEAVILGCALAAGGESPASAQFGQVVRKSMFAGGVDPIVWLRTLARELRARADDAGGLLAGLVLDPKGGLPPALGVPNDGKRNDSTGEMHNSGGISEVILVIGGPKGVDHDTSRSFRDVLRQECADTCLLRLPGGELHANVALAGLFLLIDWDIRFWARMFGRG